MERQRTSSEWMIQRLYSESATLRRLWLDSTTDSSDNLESDNATTSALTFNFTLRRANVGFNYIFVIPLLVMVVMSLTCFWMEPLSSEKLAMNCLLLLLLCGFLFGLSPSLAAPSDRTPLLLRAYIQVLVVVTCATVVTILITGVASQPHSGPLPRVVRVVLTSHFVSTFFCLPSFTEKTLNIGQKEERSTNSVEGNGRDLSIFDWQNEPNLSWTLLAVFCDRLAFIAATAAYAVLFV